MKAPFKKGDVVKKYKYPLPFEVTRTEPQDYTVLRCYKETACDSGYAVDVTVKPCPHCGQGTHTLLGYTSTWFVKKYHHPLRCIKE